MAKASHYTRASKGAIRSNPLILGEYATACAFWSLTTIMAVSIVAATYWLLTRPLA